MKGLGLCLLALALTVGCAGTKCEVPGSLVAKLPYAARVELLDAENDLIRVQQRVADADADAQHARAELKDAQAHLARMPAAASADASGAQVAHLAQSEAAARVEYRRRVQEVAGKRGELERHQLRCAAARLEWAKLRLVLRARIPGAARIASDDYESNARRCDDELGGRVASFQVELQTVRTAEVRWKTAEASFHSRTDAPASPFVE